jgi:hypothetical protein
LFFSRFSTPVGLDRVTGVTRYADSRWNIPILWWLFFSQSSLTRKRVSYDGEYWDEPYLIEAWDIAREQFIKRQTVAEDLFPDHFEHHIATRFLARIEEFADSYIHIDGAEIFEDDEDDFIRITALLHALDNHGVPRQQRVKLIDSYTGLSHSSLSQDKEKNLVGYTYLP